MPDGVYGFICIGQRGRAARVYDGQFARYLIPLRQRQMLYILAGGSADFKLVCQVVDFDLRDHRGEIRYYGSGAGGFIHMNAHFQVVIAGKVEIGVVFELAANRPHNDDELIINAVDRKHHGRCMGFRIDIGEISL